jgi:adenosylhomocysteine nucleosidase
MTAGKLGFIAALHSEAATIKRYCDLSRGKACVASQGIGPEGASAAAESLLSQGVSVLISWGTAGALEPGLAPGALILGQAAVSTTSDEVYDCDGDTTTWLDQALAPLTPIHARGLSSAEVIPDIATKSRLYQQHHCAFVDMESVTIGAIAHAAGIKFAIVRVIVDPAQFSLPESALAGLGPSEGQLRRTLTALAQHPAECGAMIKLGFWYFRALRQLSRAARLALANPAT